MPKLQDTPVGISDKLSHVPVKIFPKFNGNGNIMATGFFYEYQSKYYLITNRHNVTGKHQETNQNLDHKNGLLPNEIHIKIPYEKKIDQQFSYKIYKDIIIDIFDNKMNIDVSEPIWFEHPSFSSKIDVVAIPTNFAQENTDIYCINDKRLYLEKGKVYPGDDVFVLGYPNGFSGCGHFPIWKRGSLATEPLAQIDDLPKMYIDTATRQGMSGSPVIVDNSFLYSIKNQGDHDHQIRRGKQFLGIYSGRIGTEKENDIFAAQLGVVWKEYIIEEIIKGKKIAHNPH